MPESGKTCNVKRALANLTDLCGSSFQTVKTCIVRQHFVMEKLPFSRRNKPAPDAIEQSETEVFFQSCQRTAYSWLRKPQQIGGSTRSTGLHDHSEDIDIAQVHQRVITKKDRLYKYQS